MPNGRLKAGAPTAHRQVGTWAAVTLLRLASLQGASQNPSLRVISTTPVGELGQIEDADQRVARASGTARVRMLVTLAGDTDAFEMPLLVTEPVGTEVTAAYGDTVGTATEALALESGALPGAGGLTVDLRPRLSSGWAKAPAISMSIRTNAPSRGPRAHSPCCWQPTSAVRSSSPASSPMHTRRRPCAR